MSRLMNLSMCRIAPFRLCIPAERQQKCPDHQPSRASRSSSRNATLAPSLALLKNNIQTPFHHLIASRSVPFRHLRQSAPAYESSLPTSTRNRHVTKRRRSTSARGKHLTANQLCLAHAARHEDRPHRSRDKRAEAQHRCWRCL